MPELPDVEVFRRYGTRVAKGKKIRDVEVLDKRILEKASPKQLQKKLRGRKFGKLERHGKYLFGRLSMHESLAFHFGMTGSLKAAGADAGPPRHARVAFSLSNENKKLYYLSQRLLGNVRLINDPGRFIQDNRLGPDAGQLKAKRFDEILLESRGAVKAALMNQEKIAGIGNVYSDEILFQAHIHPDRPAGKLSGKERQTLYRSMKDVFQKAIKAGAEPDRMLPSFLTRVRGRTDKCPRCKGKIRKIKAAGRSAYLCPKCQKK